MLALFLLLRGTVESGALKANALPGGARRLAVRAVKGAQFAFIGAKRETLDRRSGRSRRSFSAGRARKSDYFLLCELANDDVRGVPVRDWYTWSGEVIGGGKWRAI